MEDISSLFKDDTATNSRKTDTMIVPVAHDSDSTVVLPLFNKCHLKVSHGNGRPCSRLSGLGALKAVFDRNVLTATTNFVELVISVIPLHFPDPCIYLNWTLFSTIFTNAPPPSSPPTISGLIAALSSLTYYLRTGKYCSWYYCHVRIHFGPAQSRTRCSWYA